MAIWYAARVDAWGRCLEEDITCIHDKQENAELTVESSWEQADWRWYIKFDLVSRSRFIDRLLCTWIYLLESSRSIHDEIIRKKFLSFEYP